MPRHHAQNSHSSHMKNNAAGNRPATSDFSRAQATERYSGARRKRGRRRGLKVFLITIVVIAALGCTAAFAFMARFSGSFGMSGDSALHGTLTEATSGDPFYMVLIGVDKDEARAEGNEYGSADSAYRTDTILLARVDPTEKQVTLVSIHRDTLIDFGSYGKQKINSAYSIGSERKEAGEEGVSGASYTVETISKFAGVPIAHYAEIDLDQFISVVDTIGGVEVNVPVDVYDPEYTGADIKAGVQTLNGDQALKLCRARHAYDKYGAGDYYRTANQRMVLGAILKKALSGNPFTLLATLNTASNSVSTDITGIELMLLGARFVGFDMSTNLYSALEPTTSSYEGGIWYERVDEAKWQTMMSRVGQGLPPYEDSSEDPTAGVAANAN